MDGWMDEVEAKSRGQSRTHVQILRRLHDESPSNGARQVELLMRAVEEADEVPDRKKRGVA